MGRTAVWFSQDHACPSGYENIPWSSKRDEEPSAQELSRVGNCCTSPTARSRGGCQTPRKTMVLFGQGRDTHPAWLHAELCFHPATGSSSALRSQITLLGNLTLITTASRDRCQCSSAAPGPNSQEAAQRSSWLLKKCHRLNTHAGYKPPSPSALPILKCISHGSSQGRRPKATTAKCFPQVA